MSNNIKRRKHKDNPYMMIYDENNNVYSIEFYDCNKNTVVIEVNAEIYNTFNQFELDDLSEMNKYDRHIEHFECSDEDIYNRKTERYNLESVAISNIFNEELLNEIEKLPEIQRRRLILYYFYDMKLEEIAKIELCTFRAVKFSIDIAIEKLYNNLKKAKTLNIDYKNVK